jgi:arsenite methyltransferase
MSNTQEEIYKSVQEYYGKELISSSDLKTNACCTLIEYPSEIKGIIAEIHDEVVAKYYGCGLTIPEELENLKILDLGSGSGRDCYIASKLVGEDGFVTGVDMTDEQVHVARSHIDYHTEKFGFKKPNVEFQKGNIEKLDELDIKESSLDLIISNCVINLSTNKYKVLDDCFKLLKNGAEMYFSDVYVNKRLPIDFSRDPVIYGECLGGALYWNDFLNISKKVGFKDPRIVEAQPITIENKDLREKLASYEFYSVTYRLYKIKELEEDCEDYGQAVIYKGTIKDKVDSFDLDINHHFPTGRVQNVCGNTFLMLQKTRYNKHFEFIGTFGQHYGIFPDCGKSNPFGNLHKHEIMNSLGCC